MRLRTLPEFVRGPFWATMEIEAEFSPKLKAAAATWAALEVESVGPIRRSALLTLTPEQAVKAQAHAEKIGGALVLMEPATVSETYLAANVDGPKTGLRCALTLDPKDWREAWKLQSNDRIGELLGFPSCCREAFGQTWGTGRHDPTPVEAAGGLDGHPGANILLRWMGVRLVPHLPCSFSCAPTIAMAEAFVLLGLRLGYDVRNLVELLCLPARYSTRHGIGEVVTPIMRFEFSSDVGTTFEAIRQAAVYEEPEEPAEKPEPLVLVEPSSEPTQWGDNGFTTKAAMDGSHHTVLAVCHRLFGTVVDLGAGDGALLAKLRAKVPAVTHAIAVEQDGGRTERGMKRSPGVEFVYADIVQALDWVEVADAVLLMPGRLLEMTAEDSEKVRRALSGKTLVVYGYSDNLAEEGLRGLCKKAGLPEPPNIVTGHGISVQAGVVRMP